MTPEEYVAAHLYLDALRLDPNTNNTTAAITATVLARLFETERRHWTQTHPITPPIP